MSDLPVKQVKPGYQSTEFWLTALAHVLTLLVMSGAFPSESVWEKVAAFALSALAQLGYSVSRGIAKK